MSHIQPPSLPAGKIQNRTLVPNKFIKFSFKYADLKHEKFCTRHCREGYLDKLLERLRDVSSVLVSDFRSNRSRALRSHQIHWLSTTEQAGFTNLNEQLRDEEAWQFELTANEHGRVHGLLIDNTFFVIWIDPAHLLHAA